MAERNSAPHGLRSRLNLGRAEDSIRRWLPADRRIVDRAQQPGRRAEPGLGVLIPATLTGVVVAAAITIGSRSPWPSWSGWVAAGYIGLGPMAAGYGLWTLAMARGGAERLSPLGYATPLLSTGLLLATGQPASGGTLVGVGLILTCSIGVLAAQRHPTGRADQQHRTGVMGASAPPART